MMHITLLLCIIYLYSLLAEAWGGVGTHFLHLPWPETLLVIYLYSLIYTILIPSRWQPWLAAVPIFVVYLVHDVFYWVYGKIFRIINITELPELLQVLPPIYAVLLMGLSIALWFYSDTNQLSSAAAHRAGAHAINPAYYFYQGNTYRLY